MARKKKRTAARSSQSAARPSRPGAANLPPAAIEGMRVALLVAICVAFWCHVYNRYSVTSWQTPIEYGINPEMSDVKSLLADAKAASEGHIWPIIPKSIPALGAPFGANWSDYPGGDELLADGAGLLTHFIGLFAAVNAMTLLAFVLAAVGFYAAARTIRCHWLWSFAGALIFSFSTFAFSHGEHHLTVIYVWHVPLCLMVCRWLSTGGGVELGPGRFAIGLGVAVITAAQNVYYTNMFVQLALLGGFFQLLRHGWKRAAPAAAVAAATAFTFLVMRSDTFIYHFLQGPNPGAVVRHYEWVEYYALKICDLFIPPPWHPFSLFADYSKDHLAHLLVPGEMPPGSYLGMVGIAACVWLVVVSTRRMLRTPPRGMPLEAWQILWILVYSTVGGLNGLAASFGFLLFRSTTRYTIFILAILLLFAARRLTAILRTRLAAEHAVQRQQMLFIAGIVATGVTAFALWDQAPPATTDSEIATTQLAVASDREFTAKMEERLPPGAMIFEIPVVDFPESPAPGISSYDHLRPYFYSHHLRYAFGSVKGRPRDEWQHAITQMSLPQAIAALESFGFSGIYVNRTALSDKGVGLEKNFRSLGYNDIIQSPAGDLFCVLIHPWKNPVTP